MIWEEYFESKECVRVSLGKIERSRHVLAFDDVLCEYLHPIPIVRFKFRISRLSFFESVERAH